MSDPPTNTDPLRRLDAQPPLVWLQERDIDLLICAELHADGPLRRQFAKIAQADCDDFRGAWVSHREDDGETDLVVGFGSAQWESLLLVENKVSAEFQPDQPQRYRERARRYDSVPPHPRVTSVLLAPAAYFGRAGSDVFNARVSYEQVIEALADSPDGRVRFLSHALQRAVLDRRHYVPEPDAAVTALWRAIYRVATNAAPLLNMAPVGEKPKGARFIKFTPDSFASIASGVDIVIKNGKGDAGPTERTFVDLQFGGTSDGQLKEATNGILRPRMFVVAAAKSASIRINLPPVDYERPADAQLPAIREAVEQADLLRRFFVRNGPVLIGRLRDASLRRHAASRMQPP